MFTWEKVCACMALYASQKRSQKHVSYYFYSQHIQRNSIATTINTNINTKTLSFTRTVGTRLPPANAITKVKSNILNFTRKLKCKRNIVTPVRNTATDNAKLHVLRKRKAVRDTAQSAPGTRLVKNKYQSLQKERRKRRDAHKRECNVLKVCMITEKLYYPV